MPASSLSPCPLCGGECRHRAFNDTVNCKVEGGPYYEISIAVHLALSRRNEMTAEEREAWEMVIRTTLREKYYAVLEAYLTRVGAFGKEK